MKKSIFIKILVTINVSFAISLLGCVILNCFQILPNALESLAYISCIIFGASALLVIGFLLYKDYLDNKKANNLEIDI